MKKTLLIDSELLINRELNDLDPVYKDNMISNYGLSQNWFNGATEIVSVSFSESVFFNNFFIGYK